MLGGIFESLFGMPEEPVPDYRNLWMEYSASSQRMNQDRETELAQMRADLAGKGIEEGSSSWNAAMQTLENRRAQERMGVDQSEIANILQENYQQNLMRARNPMFSLMGRADRRAMQNRLFGKGAAEEFEKMMAMEDGQEKRIAQRQWGARQPVTMEQFYESQFGTADISNMQPMQQAAPAENPAQIRAQRAAAGGSSSWW